MIRPYRLVVSLFSLAGAALLGGCSADVGTIVSGGAASAYTPPVGNFQGTPFSAKVMGGTTALSGATIQIYAAGNTGNGSAPVQLLSSALTADSSGAFNVSNYTCPTNTSVLFMVASGGHTGTNANNSAISLMSSPGACGSMSGQGTLVINEATTVASAYAFAQFLQPGGRLGASSTNTTGLTLAAATLTNLVNPSTGIAPGTSFPATGTAPVALLNTLANALHACVVSSGASSTACTGLFNAATVGGSAPTSTLDAVLNIVHHPGSNVAAVYALAAGSAAFAPALSAAPSDWTLYASYSGGGMNDPSSVSIDSQGRVWVANYFSVASLFTNSGAPVFPSGVTGNNLYSSYGNAIDPNDNVWIANEQTTYAINSGLGNITVLNSAGQPTGGVTGYSVGGLNFPIAIAFDTSNVAWVVDYGNSHLTLLNASGTAMSGASGYTSTQFQFPVAVAVDSKRNGYVANQSSNALVKVPADGSSFTSFNCCQGGSAVAIDGSDNAWVANYYGDSVGLVSAGGSIVSGGGFKGGGIAHPQGIAVDGAGSVWVANYRGPSITELAGANTTQPGQILSPAAGWGKDAQLLEAFGLAIDGSGNIWVTNFGSNTLTEFIGLAAPVKTPAAGPVRTP